MKKINVASVVLFAVLAYCHKYVRGVRLTDTSTLDTFVSNSMTHTGS